MFHFFYVSWSSIADRNYRWSDLVVGFAVLYHFGRRVWIPAGTQSCVQSWFRFYHSLSSLKWVSILRGQEANIWLIIYHRKWQWIIAGTHRLCSSWGTCNYFLPVCSVRKRFCWSLSLPCRCCHACCYGNWRQTSKVVAALLLHCELESSLLWIVYKPACLRYFWLFLVPEPLYSVFLIKMIFLY